MIRTVIIDDEQHCIDRLLMLLKKHFPEEIQVVETCNNILAGFDAINKNKPDFIFLDVMIHEQTGFDLLQKFQKPTFRVVFTTAHEHFALQAIKFSAFDFLLKPIDIDDLKQTIKKIQENTTSNEPQDNFKLLFENFNNITKQNKKIAIPTINGLEFLHSADIIRCKSDVNYTTIHSKNRKPFMVAKTLKDFEEMLTPLGFYRVHNSHLINLEYVKSYNKGGYVELEDGSEIEVSTRRKDEFLKRLSEH